MKKETIKGIPIHCAYDKLVLASNLVFSQHHKREHPPEHVAKIGQILKANGWRRAIVVSERSGVVTKGRGRALFAIETEDVVPVEYQKYQAEADEIRDIIADNSAPEGSIDDMKAIAELVADSGEDAEAFGLDDETMEALLGEVEKITKPKKARNGSGYQYKLTFDDAGQLQVWQRFLAKLEKEYAGRPSVAARVIEFISTYADT